MDGDDEFRIGGAIFELFSQLGDVHVDRAGQGRIVIIPDRVQEFVASDHLASMLDEVLQKFEFD